MSFKSLHLLQVCCPPRRHHTAAAPPQYPPHSLPPLRPSPHQTSLKDGLDQAMFPVKCLHHSPTARGTKYRPLNRAMLSGQLPAPPASPLPRHTGLGCAPGAQLSTQNAHVYCSLGLKCSCPLFFSTCRAGLNITALEDVSDPCRAILMLLCHCHCQDQLPLLPRMHLRGLHSPMYA